MHAEGRINYLGDMAERPRFYAVDYSRDNLIIRGEPLPIRDARMTDPPPSLDRARLRSSNQSSESATTS